MPMMVLSERRFSSTCQRVGVAVAAVVMGLSVLLGVVSGLLGIGAGIYYKNLLAIVTGTLGLILIGFVVKSFISALTTF